MTVFRSAVLAAAFVATAAPASVIYEQTIDPGEGMTSATIYVSLYPYGEIWVRSSAGPLLGGWMGVNGLKRALWWEPSYDEDGNETPRLTGNEYLYDPGCGVDTALPVCNASGVVGLQLHANLLKSMFAPPPSFDFCVPFPGYYIDCHVSYDFYAANFEVTSATPASRPVTFTFYDSQPVPEPAGWALLIAGFALTGAVLRQRRGAIA
jgi:hypothetical protein